MPLGDIISGIATAIVATFHKLVDWFMTSAPKPLRVFVFMMLLITMGNIISSVILSTSFVCTSVNQIRRVTIWDGVRIFFTRLVTPVSDSDIVASSSAYTQQTKLFWVGCANKTPRPFFYNIDVLSYPLWLLLLLVIYAVPLIIKWYKAMGVVH